MTNTSHFVIKVVMQVGGDVVSQPICYLDPKYVLWFDCDIYIRNIFEIRVRSEALALVNKTVMRDLQKCSNVRPMHSQQIRI